MNIFLKGQDKKILLCYMEKVNPKLNYHIFVTKYYLFLALVTSAKMKMKK